MGPDIGMSDTIQVRRYQKKKTPDGELQTVNCDECGWSIDVTHLTKKQAFQEAQDHEDIEHEGSRIEWHGVH